MGARTRRDPAVPAASGLLALLVAQRCGGCGDRLPPMVPGRGSVMAWCGHCRDRWGAIPGAWPVVAGECPGWAAAAYRGPVRRAVLAAKRGAPVASRELLALRIGAAVVPRGAEVTWVPAHPRRAIRGPDAGDALAQAVAAQTGAEVRQLLGRSVLARRQAGLPDLERRRNPDRLGLRVRGRPSRSVVLVDDVRTTGTTLNHAADLLRRAGAEQVVAIVVAVAPASLDSGR